MVGGGRMSERFQELSEEKQLAILRAATEVLQNMNIKKHLPI